LLHASEVLNDALKSDKKQNSGTDSEKMQETLIIHYLASLGVKMEDMDEDRVMDLMEQNNLVPLFISHLHKHYTWYKIETLEAASKFLSSVMASEAYQTDKTRFIKDQEVTKQIVGLKGFFIHELVTVYGLKRKDVQSLLDELAKFEKVVGPAVITPLKPKQSTPVTSPASASSSTSSSIAASTSATATSTTSTTTSTDAKDAKAP